MRKLLLWGGLFLLPAMGMAATIRFGPDEVDLGQGGGTGVYGTPTNEWSAFGIQIEDAYLYNDSRDTFDRMGLSQNNANGARVIFDSALSELKFDYWVIAGHTGRYSVFDSLGVFIDAISVDASGGDINATHTFVAADIKRLEWTGGTGHIQVTTLFTGPDTGIPEPGSWAMLLSGGAVLVGLARRRRG